MKDKCYMVFFDQECRIVGRPVRFMDGILPPEAYRHESCPPLESESPQPVWAEGATTKIEPPLIPVLYRLVRILNAQCSLVTYVVGAYQEAGAALSIGLDPELDDWLRSALQLVLLDDRGS